MKTNNVVEKLKIERSDFFSLTDKEKIDYINNICAIILLDDFPKNTDFYFNKKEIKAERQDFFKMSDAEKWDLLLTSIIISLKMKIKCSN